MVANSILKKLLVFFIVFHFMHSAFAQWEYVGEQNVSAGNGNYIHLKFSGDTPYVAYKDWANDFKATVKRYNGSNWEAVGTEGFSNEVAAFLDFTFYNGNAVVTIMDNDNAGSMQILQFTDNVWQEIPSPTNFRVQYVNVVADEDYLYVAYKDFKNRKRATVQRYDGSTWEVVGEFGFTEGQVFSLDLELNNGQPFIAFSDASERYKATVMSFNGTEWSYVGKSGISENEADFTRLKIINDVPYLAFVDEEMDERVSVMMYNGSDWVYIGNRGFSDRLASYVNIESNDSVAYVSYDAGNSQAEGAIQRFNGTSWEAVSSIPFIASPVSQLSLQFNQGIPYVAFSDIGNASRISVMQFNQTLSLDQKPKLDFTVFPNPVTDKITLSNPDNQLLLAARLVDISGKTVLKIMLNSSDRNIAINIGYIESGIYFFNVETERGAKSIKVIKK